MNKRAPGRGSRAAPTFRKDDPLPNRPNPQNPQPLGPKLVARLDALLSGCWPGRLHDLFDPAAPKPLQIGIHDALAEALGLDERGRKQLGKILARWCGRFAYQRALGADGAMRHGIGGEPVGQLLLREPGP